MKVYSGIVAFGLLGGCLLGCGGSSTGQLPDPNYRFVNLCTDANLDMLVDDDIEFTNIAFLDTTTIFKSKESKLREYAIQENGSTVIIDSQSQTMSDNTDNLIIAFGLNNFSTENEKRLRFLFQPVNRTVPNGSKARVYGINTFCRDFGSQNFAVIFKNPGTISTINFNPVNFGEVTVQEIDAGPTTLVAQRQNTDTEVATVTKTFEAGKIYVMALTGTESGTGANAPAINFIEVTTR
ncbi:MAG: hypothetical protein WCI55_05565 [Armatimonadota bacterium]